MKRIFYCLIVILFVIMGNLLLSSCSIEKITEITLSQTSAEICVGEFDFEDYFVTVHYSSGREEQIKLTEDMISPSDRVKLYQVGEQKINVVYQRRSCEFNVIVTRNLFGNVIFNDLITTYTGDNITLNAENLPEGTTVIYPDGNSYKNAGEYAITAILKKDGYELTTLTANLIINKADYDLSGIGFNDKTEVYDGEQKRLEIAGELPAGLIVSYNITKDGRTMNGNSATNSGVYTVVASFSGDNDNFNFLENLQN